MELRGFDSYNISLGDEMRGERASLGKSLEQAEADLREAIEVNPDLADARIELIRLLERRGRTDEASEAARAFAAHAPDDRDAARILRRLER